MPDSRSSSRSSSSRSSGEHAPTSPGLHSTSALILVSDVEDSSAAVSFSDDEDEELPTGVPQVTPLSSTAVFLYLLSPSLKLGAMLIVNGYFPITLTIPCLVFFSILSALAKHIWFLLARYVRKPDLEDIILEAFARGRRKERRKAAVRALVRFGTGFLRLMLATVYLRDSVDNVVSHIPGENVHLIWRLAIGFVFAIFLVPLCFAPSLASKRLVYTTGGSIVLYVVWLSTVAFAHARGLLGEEATLYQPGGLWQDITIIAFSFTSSNALHLYASVIGTASAGAAKEKRFQSITWTSLFSAILGMCMVLPLLFFQTTYSDSDPSTEYEASSTHITIATLSSVILVLAIPPLVVTSPTLPVPLAVRRFTRFPVSRIILLFSAFLLSLVPSGIVPILGNTVIVMGSMGTYFLPALIHIKHHHLSQPLSIVIPPNTPNPSAAFSSATHDPATDELLRRKEQALQRRRLGRRVLWDIGVWLLLIPVGVGGSVWAVGRLAGKW